MWKTSKHGGITSMSGVRQPMAEAPVIVYAQDEGRIMTENTANKKRNDAIMIPAKRFYDARKVYLRKNKDMDPQLRDVLRPLFED